MKLDAIQFFAAAPAAALVLPLALAFAPRSEPAPVRVAIPMGRTQVTGGTTRIGEIDPAAIPTAGPDAVGEFSSAIPGGSLEGLDIAIEKGSAHSICVDGGTPVLFTDGVAHVPIALSAGAQRGYAIRKLSGDGSAENSILHLTPSDVKTVAGLAVESNILPVYRFDRISDLARNGARVYRRAALALVHNDDDSERMVSIAGTVSFPGSASAKLMAVHTFEPDEDPLRRAQVALAGDEFAISGFGGVAPGDCVQVLLVFDVDLGGEPVRAQIQGTFAP